MKLLDVIFESVIELNEKMTQDEFIDKSNKVHGDRYDYKDVNYVNNRTNVTIICKKHGPFRVIPSNFLAGGNCPECGKESRRQKQISNTDEFIKRAIERHGDKYDYTKVDYKTAKIPDKKLGRKMCFFTSCCEIFLLSREAKKLLTSIFQLT